MSVMSICHALRWRPLQPLNFVDINEDVNCIVPLYTSVATLYFDVVPCAHNVHAMLPYITAGLGYITAGFGICSFPAAFSLMHLCPPSLWSCSMELYVKL